MKDISLSKIIEEIAPGIEDSIKIEKIPERNLETDETVTRQSKDTVRLLKSEIRKKSPYEVICDTTSFADGLGIIVNEYVNIREE